jgi:hypothetical protein
MNDKHKTQVYLVDSNNNNANANSTTNCVDLDPKNPEAKESAQTPVNDNTIIQLVSKDSNNEYEASKKAAKAKKTYPGHPSRASKPVNGEHQQIRSFINSSSHISRQYKSNHQQNTTVRINPLLLKRHNMIKQQQQQQLEQQQQIHQLAQQLANETSSTNAGGQLVLVSNGLGPSDCSSGTSTELIGQIVVDTSTAEFLLATETDDKLLQLIS